LKKTFKKNISHLIDAFESLPYRPDFAFDTFWRIVDSYTTVRKINLSWNAGNITDSELLVDNIVLPVLQKSNTLKKAFDELCNMIPTQAVEFVHKRSFGISAGTIDIHQDDVNKRVRRALGIDLYNEIKNKYSKLGLQSQRDFSKLIHILFNSEAAIKINSDAEFILSEKNKFMFIKDGLLYSYRNERFHGNIFSPFRSSKVTLNTFSHPYYCCLFSYAIILFMMHEEFPLEIKLESIESNLNENINRFKQVFIT
jgi:hypothetical protein